MYLFFVVLNIGRPEAPWTLSMNCITWCWWLPVLNDVVHYFFSRRRDRSRDRDKRRSRSSSSSDDDRGRKRKRSRSPKKHKKKRRWLIWPSKKVTTLPTDTSSIFQYGVLPSDIYTIFDVASISITKYPLLGLLMALCPKNMQSTIYSCKKIHYDLSFCGLNSK